MPEFYRFLLMTISINTVILSAQNELKSSVHPVEELLYEDSSIYINKTDINHSSNRGYNMILMEDYNVSYDYYDNFYWDLNRSYHWTYDGNGNQITYVIRDGDGTNIDSTFYAYEDFLDVDDFIIGIPKEYNLSKPYPNPFNPITIINCAIPNTGFISIIVYDIMGREIKTIVNREFQEGSYSFEWTANNQPSGIYFIRMESGGYNKMQKVILLK